MTLGGQWYLASLSVLTPDAVIAVTVVEHFCAGALTTAMRSGTSI